MTLICSSDITINRTLLSVIPRSNKLVIKTITRNRCAKHEWKLIHVNFATSCRRFWFDVMWRCKYCRPSSWRNFPTKARMWACLGRDSRLKIDTFTIIGVKVFPLVASQLRRFVKTNDETLFSSTIFWKSETACFFWTIHAGRSVGLMQSTFVVSYPILLLLFRRVSAFCFIDFFWTSSLPGVVRQLSHKRVTFHVLELLPHA